MQGYLIKEYRPLGKVCARLVYFISFPFGLFCIMDDEMSVKYVWLEPAAFLTDIDFQMMNAEQRGVYWSIILYLYANNGKIDLNDNTDITLLQTKVSVLAIISNCQKVGSDWDTVWGKIRHKFKITGNILTHKRVTEELERAENYKKLKSEAGKKGMQKRWGDNTDITKVSKGKVSKGKESTKNTYMEFVFLTDEEHEKLVRLFSEQGTKDRIAALNDYIGSKGKKYKSHYHTILTWDRKNGNSEQPKKLQLFPIKGKNCNVQGCNLPAVYKDSSGSYDSYACAEHMPDKVKKLYA